MRLSLKLLVAIAAVGALTMYLPESVKAVDSCSSADDLLACADQSVTACRDQYNCSTDLEQAVTINDAVEEAQSRCCSKPTGKQTKCFKARSRKYLVKGTAPVLKKFVRQANFDVKNATCSTGSNGTF